MIYNIVNIKKLKWNFKNYKDLISFYRKIPLSFFLERNIYIEKHHILPKCMGGENTKNNLIYLPWMIHIFAHFLLAKELEKINIQFSQKNYYAVRMILNQDKVKNIEELKKITELKSIELETKNKLNYKKIFIKKDGEKSILIFEEEFQKYKELGWEKGRNFNRGNIGTIWINDGRKSFLIKKEELQNYLLNGFKKGMYKTQAMKEYNHAQKEKYTTKGWKWIFKEGEKSLLLKPSEVEKYLKKGWKLGSNRKTHLKKNNPSS